MPRCSIYFPLHLCSCKTESKLNIYALTQRLILFLFLSIWFNLLLNTIFFQKFIFPHEICGNGVKILLFVNWVSASRCLFKVLETQKNANQTLQQHFPLLLMGISFNVYLSIGLSLFERCGIITAMCVCMHKKTLPYLTS